VAPLLVCHAIVTQLLQLAYENLNYFRQSSFF